MENTKIPISEAFEITVKAMKEYTDSNTISYSQAQFLDEDAKTVAKNNVGVYIQEYEPTEAVDGDIWIDTDDDLVIPGYTENDNGKFLRIVNGVATWAFVASAEEGRY